MKEFKVGDYVHWNQQPATIMEIGNRVKIRLDYLLKVTGREAIISVNFSELKFIRRENEEVEEVKEVKEVEEAEEVEDELSLDDFEVEEFKNEK